MAEPVTSPAAALEALALRLIAAYVRHTPIDQGRFRVREVARALVAKHGARMGRRVVRTRYGFALELDLQDWIAKHIYVTEVFEAGCSTLLERRLRPGDTLVDVGANIGYFAVLGARLVGPGGKVIAVEPNPDMRARIQRNLQRNGIGNVELLDCALVEGAGLKVLHDMRQYLEAHRPELIVELSPDYLRDLGADVPALLDFLAGYGYTGNEIREHEMVAFARSDLAALKQFNAFFTTQPLAGPVVVSRALERRP